MATLDALMPSQAGVTRLAVPVRSPLAGVVTDIAVQPGDAVSAGQVMLTLMDPGQMWVTASVHESRIAQVRVGQRVRIQVNTRSVQRVFWGRVEQIGKITTTALADKTRGTDVSTPRTAEVPIRISLDPAGYQLYPGMTAQVRIGLSPR
jgi:membrane fusion protein, multidrug efflux system